MRTRHITIPNVVICRTGSWPAMSGEFACTRDDLVDAVRAAQDSGFWAPRGKIGDTLHSKQGKAVGRYENLRLVDNVDGTTDVVADHACVPEAFADKMPSEYPNRSIEAKRNVTSPVTGERYRLAFTAVELLGVEGPAVRSLPDITPEQIESAMSIAAAADSSVEGAVVSTPVLAAAVTITDDDVRRAWSVQNPPADSDSGPYSGVVDFYAQPQHVIVDHGNGTCMQHDWSVNAAGEISFGDGSPVQRAWVPTDASTVSASAPVHADDHTGNRREEATVDPKELREAAGLGDDATDADVLEALRAQRTTQPTTTEGAPTSGDTGGEGGTGDVTATDLNAGETVQLSAGRLQQLEADAASGREARKILHEQKRDQMVLASVGKRIAPFEVDAYKRKFDADPEATTILLTADVKDGGLHEIRGLAELGTEGDADNIAASASDDDALYTAWMGGLVKGAS